MGLLVAYLARLSRCEQRRVDEAYGEVYPLRQGGRLAILVEGEERQERLVQHQHCGRTEAQSGGFLGGCLGVLHEVLV